MVKSEQFVVGAHFKDGLPFAQMSFLSELPLRGVGSVKVIRAVELPLPYSQ